MNGPSYPPSFPPPPPPSPSPGAAPAQAPGATAALVLGILSIVICPLCGPFAWSLGRKGEQAADASGGSLGGRGLATAGKILGMIGTFFLLLLIVLLVLSIAFGGGGGGSDA
ncbi:MAG: DUF4190 domain-containing protein [Solirubrobacteraceae bacterium]|nr:DUF4190 domain-containing protein [Solirubrobacteraceae bacterium]